MCITHGCRTLEAHLVRWMREAAALKPLAAKAPFLQMRELTRHVHTDSCIELDTNRYSVPWKLIGETVTVIVAERQVRVLYAGQEAACHAQSPLRRATIIDRRHLTGVIVRRTPSPPAI